MILAAPRTAYSAMKFQNWKMGVVNCPAGNNVAWLECATFDACKINIRSTPSQSYWGIQGREVTASTVSGNECFEAYPPNSTTTIHHIISANDIANGCGDEDFASGGICSDDIAYNADDNAECSSGIDVVVPVNSDTLPGTHIYIAENFS
jgi:hypothetical protein